jgi:hypothetical protein
MWARFTSRFHIGVLLGVLLCALAYWQFNWLGAAPGDSIPHGSNEDWDWQLSMVEVTRLGVMSFGELPVWNPYTQGGVPLLANPEFTLFYPPFALILVLGTELGLKAWVLAHWALLIWACWLAGREIGLSKIGAHGASLFLLCSAFLPTFVAYGHIMFLPLGWLPLAWVAARRGWWQWAALCLAMSFLAGGHYLLVYGALWLSLDAVFRGVEEDRLRWLVIPLGINALLIGVGWMKWPVLLGLVGCLLFLRLSKMGTRAKSLLATGVVCGLLLGVKIAPAPVLFERAERLEAQVALSIADACPGQGPFDPDTCYSSFPKALGVMSGADERLSGHEGQNVFGSVWPVLIGLFGLIWAAFVAPAWGLIGLVFWCLGWGGATPVNLLEALHRLPGFDHLRVVERYALMWTLFLGWGAGFFFDRATSILKGWGSLPVVFVLGMWVRQATPSSRAAMNIGPQRARPVPLVAGPFEQLEGPHSNFEAIRAGKAKLDCWTTAWLEDPGEGLSAVGRKDYHGEAYMSPSGVGVPLAVTTSRMTVTLPVDGKVVINQNYFKGWEVGGHHVENHRGLISANLTAGEHEFRYRPPGLRFGLGLSGLGLVLLCVFGRRKGFGPQPSEDEPPP